MDFDIFLSSLQILMLSIYIHATALPQLTAAEDPLAPSIWDSIVSTVWTAVLDATGYGSSIIGSDQLNWKPDC